MLGGGWVDFWGVLEVGWGFGGSCGGRVGVGG